MSSTQRFFKEKPVSIAVKYAFISVIALSAASFVTQSHAQSRSMNAIPAQHFSIPAGDLGTTLSQFAVDQQIPLSFDPQLTASHKNPAVNGNYSGAEVIQRLLQGSGLTLVAQGNGSYTLQKSIVADNTLPEVQVNATASYTDLPAAAAGGQVAKGSRLGLLGNKNVMDTPFNTTAFTAKAMTDQQSKTLTSVLENDPSVRFTTSAGHSYENYTIRGFEVTSGNVAWNGLYGIAPDGHIPTEMLERVELLKGPSALLSGMSPGGAVGGTVNVVPKRAETKPLTRITTFWTSDSQFGISADIGRRFGEEKRLGIRVNATHSDGDTAIDAQKKKHQLASVALDYQADNWNVQLDAYTMRERMRNGSPVMVSFSTLKHLINAPDATTNLFQGVYADQDSDGASLRSEINLTPQWTVYGAVGTAKHSYRGYLNGTRVILLGDDGSARGQTYHQAGYTRNVTAEAGIKTNFTTGSIGHEVVLSANTLHQTSGLYSPVPTSASYITNIYAPVTPLYPATEPGAPVRTTKNEISSLALADNISLLEDKLQFILGMRSQTVKQKMSKPAYDKTATTPAVGIIVKPWGEDITLYANYIEGLSAGRTVGDTYANAGETFAPYKTKQKEIGVKWQYGTLTNTVDIFEIKQPSFITTSNNYLALNGQQRNRGMEWNIFGEATPATRLLGGIAYIQSKQVSTQNGEKDGNSVYGVPRWTANLGGEWDTPWVERLTLTGRTIYTGSQWADSNNNVKLPSWMRVDLGARYTTRFYNKDVVFRGNIENVFNKKYWAGTFNDGFATVGSARSFQISASVDF